MKLFLILLAFSLLHQGAVVVQGQLRTAILYPDYFSCEGLKDGSYAHPNDCTRFILCGNGRGRDDPCLWCDLVSYPEQCAGSPFLVFDPALKLCRFPSQFQCNTGSGAPMIDPQLGNNLGNGLPQQFGPPEQQQFGPPQP